MKFSLVDLWKSSPCPSDWLGKIFLFLEKECSSPYFFVFLLCEDFEAE